MTKMGSKNHTPFSVFEFLFETGKWYQKKLTVKNKPKVNPHLKSPFSFLFVTFYQLFSNYKIKLWMGLVR